MIKKGFRVPENCRINAPHLPSRVNELVVGTGNGMFRLESPLPGRLLACLASDGGGWEHVSVSAWQGKKSRTPTWKEMCFVKSVFWGPEDTVLQFHPPESEYVSLAENCLHLWRPIGVEFPKPHFSMVGPKVTGSDT